MSVAPCAASSKGKEKRGDGAISRIFQGEDCEGGAQRFRGQVERVVPIGVATRARGRTSGLERLVARVDEEGEEEEEEVRRERVRLVLRGEGWPPSAR
jgi:hypothetical protein